MPETEPPIAPSKPVKPATHCSLYVYPVSAVTNAVAVTMVMNPFDKALYLSTALNRPFFSKSNFLRPYKGALPTIVQKMTFGSTYYIFQGIMQDNCDETLIRKYHCSSTEVAFINGIVAGSINCLISNPFSAIKYHSWNPIKGGFIQCAGEMWKAGRFEPFFRGITDGSLRDLLGCAAYEITRGFLREHAAGKKSEEAHKKLFNAGFFCDMAGAAAGTVIGGPFNFTRNEKYHAPSDKQPPATKDIIHQVWNEAKANPQKMLGKTGFFLHRFNVGWGTVLTAIKMASSQLVFDTVKTILTPDKVENEPTSTKFKP
jgi:hypothetical protein